MSKSTRKKLLRTSVLLTVLGAFGGYGAFSAFTANTSNANNAIQSGSVAISDTDSVGGTAGLLYSATNQKPGAANGPAPRCIRVTYNGSLQANVRLYRGSASNGTVFQLKVERGTGLTSANNTMDCAGFTPAATNPVAYDGTLAAFPTSFAGSSVHGKDAGAAWNSGDSVDYRFTIYTIDNTTANAHTSALSTGNHTIFWEAQNN